jgi:ornithine cyclodeaminase/alanine dehydrogenase-like protein (mu-crystallin family)
MAAQIGVPVTPVGEARAAITGADIVVTITSAREPVLDGDWLAPGAHVNAAGVNQSVKQEIDAGTVRRAGTIVVDLLSQARTECGDLIAAEQASAFDWSRAVELAAVVSGQTPGRQSADEITLFESQGIALEDVAVGALVYRRAVEQGIGVDLPISEGRR